MNGLEALAVAVFSRLLLLTVPWEIAVLGSMVACTWQGYTLNRSYRKSSSSSKRRSSSRRSSSSTPDIPPYASPLAGLFLDFWVYGVEFLPRDVVLYGLGWLIAELGLRFWYRAAREVYLGFGAVLGGVWSLATSSRSTGGRSGGRSRSPGTASVTTASGYTRSPRARMATLSSDPYQIPARALVAPLPTDEEEGLTDAQGYETQPSLVPYDNRPDHLDDPDLNLEFAGTSKSGFVPPPDDEFWNSMDPTIPIASGSNNVLPPDALSSTTNLTRTSILSDVAPTAHIQKASSLRSQADSAHKERERLAKEREKAISENRVFDALAIKVKEDEAAERARRLEEKADRRLYEGRNANLGADTGTIDVEGLTPARAIQKTEAALISAEGTDGKTLRVVVGKTGNLRTAVRDAIKAHGFETKLIKNGDLVITLQ